MGRSRWIPAISGLMVLVLAIGLTAVGQMSSVQAQDSGPVSGDLVSLGKALFFENVKGSAFPVVTNMFGSFERMSLALEVKHLDDVGKRIEELLHQSPPKTLMEKLAMLPKLFELSKYLPKTVRHAPCQDVVEKEGPDLQNSLCSRHGQVTDSLLMKADSSPSLWCLPKTLKQASRIAACIESIFTTRTQPVCTGISTRMGQGTMINTEN